MDRWTYPFDRIEEQERNSYRQNILFDEKPTSTERLYLKDMIKAVEIRMSEIEERMRILEASRKKQVMASGPQENNIASSFEALLFWFKLLENKVAVYSDKIPIETEFGPRVKIIRRKIRILVKRESNSMNNHEN
jgi:hypothetical protein